MFSFFYNRTDRAFFTWESTPLFIRVLSLSPFIYTLYELFLDRPCPFICNGGILCYQASNYWIFRAGRPIFVKYIPDLLMFITVSQNHSCGVILFLFFDLKMKSCLLVFFTQLKAFFLRLTLYRLFATVS